VERVNILTTGGSLYCDDLAAWMLDTRPEKAVMVGIVTYPIYLLFDDTKDSEKAAYNYLKEYIDKNYNLKASYGGNASLK
jgi:hypothetical protein